MLLIDVRILMPVVALIVIITPGFIFLDEIEEWIGRIKEKRRAKNEKYKGSI